MHSLVVTYHLHKYSHALHESVTAWKKQKESVRNMEWNELVNGKKSLEWVRQCTVKKFLKATKELCVCVCWYILVLDTKLLCGTDALIKYYSEKRCLYYLIFNVLKCCGKLWKYSSRTLKHNVQDQFISKLSVLRPSSGIQTKWMWPYKKDLGCFSKPRMQRTDLCSWEESSC